MQLSELLYEKKVSLLEKWIDCALAVYHKDASSFLKKQKNQFANPLGYTASNSLTKIFDVLCKDCPVNEASKALEDFVKIRAVQELSPAQALSFVYDLKKIMKDEGLATDSTKILQELLIFNSRIDELAMMAFDLYMESRERLYRVRLDEFKRGTHILTDGAVCPSALIRQNMQQIKDIKPINSSK
jgi:hypothetical protein